MSNHSLLAGKTELLHPSCAECVIFTEGMSARAVLRLHRMLQALHFRVICCDSAQAALRTCARDDVVLLLAGGTGHGRALMSALRERRRDERQVACLAVLPRDAGPEEILETLMAGADECLVWPFSATLLARHLQRVLHVA